MSADPDILAEVPLFQLLDADERAALAAKVEAISAPAGKMLFSYGDPGDSLYIVREGEVEIFFKNDTGQRIVLERPGAGDFFGELSLIDAGPRTASALVTKDLQAVVVDREDIEALLKQHPAAAMDLLTATGKRLREASRQLRHAASRDINEEVEDTRTTVMKMADWISEFSGSLPFLFIHCVLFALWIVLNTGPLERTHPGRLGSFPLRLPDHVRVAGGDHPLGVRAAQPEPPGRARSHPQRHRVPGQPEGGAGDRAPAREDRRDERRAARPAHEAGTHARSLTAVSRAAHAVAASAGTSRGRCSAT